jgi:hypothetical protein
VEGLTLVLTVASSLVNICQCGQGIELYQILALSLKKTRILNFVLSDTKTLQFVKIGVY